LYLQNADQRSTVTPPTTAASGSSSCRSSPSVAHSWDFSHIATIQPPLCSTARSVLRLALHPPAHVRHPHRRCLGSLEEQGSPSISVVPPLPSSRQVQAGLLAGGRGGSAGGGGDDGEEDGRGSRPAMGRRGSGAGRRRGGGGDAEQAGNGEEGGRRRQIRRWKRRSRGRGDLRIRRVGLEIPAWRGMAASRPQDSDATGRRRPAVAAAPAVADGLRRRLWRTGCGGGRAAAKMEEAELTGVEELHERPRASPSSRVSTVARMHMGLRGCCWRRRPFAASVPSLSLLHTGCRCRRLLETV
jgi:hypothetical protein